MKARLVEESINEFHQSGDPIKSLDLGIHSIYQYIENICKENELDSYKFWEDHTEQMAQQYSKYDLYEILMNAVENLPLDKQILFIKDGINEWIKNNGTFNI